MQMFSINFSKLIVSEKVNRTSCNRRVKKLKLKYKLKILKNKALQTICNTVMGFNQKSFQRIVVICLLIIAAIFVSASMSTSDWVGTLKSKRYPRVVKWEGLWSKCFINLTKRTCQALDRTEATGTSQYRKSRFELFHEITEIPTDS